MKLLHISASPRGERSESRALAATFLGALAEDVEVDEYDLWDGTLPAFGPDAAAAKMAVFAGAEPEGPAKEAWAAARATFERLAAADAYLFSVPMWNAGVPYILKQFIDVVSQPGMVFGFDPEHGYQGLLTGRRAAIVYTSAVYPAFGSDFQAPYLEDWLRWAGVTEISTVHFRPNLVTADPDTGRRQAHEQARREAKNFARG